MADFASHAEALRAAGIDVIAASVDDLEATRKIVAETNFPFPIAYGLDAEATAQALGGYYEADADAAYLQPAGFIVAPDDRIVNSTYSTGPVGRLEARDALQYVGIITARPES